MAKRLITNYTFNAAAKTVTFRDYATIDLASVLIITNVTDGIIIYNFSSPTLNGTAATNVLTLTYNTTGMANNDDLQIWYESPSPSPVALSTDNAAGDAFSRLRVSATDEVFSVQTQYDAEPLQMEGGATGTGVAPAHVAATRMVTLSATAGTGTSFIQSYQYHPYQPGRSHFIAITGVLGAGVAATTVDVGYFDAANGIIFRQNGATNLQFIQRTSTGGSKSDAEIVAQSAWNLDKLDGTGPSGFTLDVTTAFILIIDLQFLGMGRVRIGFDLDGVIVYAHQFLNANALAVPYMQTASLPVGMVITAASSGATKTSYFKCATVQSESGAADLTGYTMSTPETTATAGSGSRVPLIAVRPKTTFNSITNRASFEIQNLNLLATGANPVFWELVVGGEYSGQTYADVNATYSAFEYTSVPGAYTNLTGGIVLASGYIGGVGSGATAQPPTITPITLPSLISRKFPITLDRAGAVRALGTLTVLVTGIGGTSACRGSMTYKEVR